MSLIREMKRGSSSRLVSVIVTVMLASTLLVATAQRAEAATVVVNQNHEHGWHMRHIVGCQDDDPSTDEGENTGDQRFVAGPQGAPGPEGNQPEAPVDSDSPNGGPPGPSAGSLEMTTGENGNTVEEFRNVDYEGVAIDDITSMNYWTYEDPRVGEDENGLPILGYVPAIYIRLVVDKDGSGNGPLDQLVFEPAYQEGDEQHDVDPAAWQKWIADDPDATAPEGKWWLASVGQAVADMKSLDEWTPETGPEWTIVNPNGLGGVILGAGCGEGTWEDFLGNTDRFTIDVTTNGATTSTTYDFEPSSPADATLLDCSPESDDNPTRTDHEVTCAATNSDEVPIPGTEIDVELTGANDPDGDSKETPDFTCVTDEAGECSFTHGPDGEPPISSDASGTSIYTAWIDVDEDNSSVEADQEEGQVESSDPGTDREPDGTDVVKKEWIERTAEGGGVDAEPDTDQNELGQNHSVEATVYDQFGDPLPGTTTVKFEFFQGSPSDRDGNSPQTPDGTCTTPGSASCAFTYTQTTLEGVDWICVFTNATPSMTGDNRNGQCDRETVTDADDEPGAADSPHPANDDQDVVSKRWVAPSVSHIDCGPEAANGPTGSAHRIACSALSRTGHTVPFVNIDGEVTGANDPDNGDSRTTPDLTCTTGSTGTCTMTHGPTGRGTTTNTGTSRYRIWIDSSDNDGPAEADGAEGRDEATQPGSNAEPDITDVVEMTWGTSPLECEPETDVAPSGSPHSVTCSATQGSVIDVEVTGANDPDSSDSPTSPDLTCTVGSSGQCVMTSTSGGPGSSTSATGSASYRAWIDADGSDQTTEADATEGRDETADPGTIPESDTTEVVERTWTNDPITDCNDRADNDGDGFVDHPDDPGCDAPADDSERDPRPQRSCRGYRGDPRNQVVGTPGRDVLRGTARADIICGLGGGDTLVGRGGKDLLLGGAGDDTARGGASSDTIRGQRGQDVLRGEGGSDRVFGGTGTDRIDGGHRRDRCRGGPGRDSIRRCE